MPYAILCYVMPRRDYAFDYNITLFAAMIALRYERRHSAFFEMPIIIINCRDAARFVHVIV